MAWTLLSWSESPSPQSLPPAPPTGGLWMESDMAGLLRIVFFWEVCMVGMFDCFCFLEQRIASGVGKREAFILDAPVCFV